MNYKIIQDEVALRAFIAWLPELEADETFYCCLFARSKYCKHIAHIKSDKAQLKRFTSNKERLFNKIMQLECPVGSYTCKESYGGQIPVPQEALALYITINPRSFVSATRNSLRKLLDLAMQPYSGYHPYQEVMSEVQQAKSKTRFVTFDFDVDKSLWTEIHIKISFTINPEALHIVETRGGFHVLVETDKILDKIRKDWYLKMTDILGIYSSDRDNKGDIMLPVPGTYQGGFVPKFI